MNKKMQRWPALAAGCACLIAIIAAALLLPENHSTAAVKVALSCESGFYDAPFQLELTGEGEIHYTLDSSDPDADSPLYTGPIQIGDASQNANVYSAIGDVALDIGAADLLQEAGFALKFNYRIPDAPVDKATVVRAVAIDGMGRRSETATGVYFVGYGDRPAYDGMNVITITTDPANLFDSARGIYVLGDAFQNVLKDGAIKLSKNANTSFLPANYWYRGMDWERRASVCFFDADRQLITSGDCGIRIQGRAGNRPKLPKSLNLFARGSYGAASFPGEVADLGFDLTHLNLNSGSNDVNSLLKDRLVNALCADLNIGTREYMPYVLFLDGEYWGVYWLTPRYKKDYLSPKYGVVADNLVVYYAYEPVSSANNSIYDNQLTSDHGRIEVGREDDMALFDAMRDFILHADMAEPESYARACELIDMESCLDYYALEIYIANTDWPKYNTALWRTRDLDSGQWGDCRWRWLLFDVNSAMKADDARLDCVERTIEMDEFFAALMDSPEFSDRFYKKLVSLAYSEFAPDRVDPFINEYEAAMQAQMQLKNLRFYNGEKTEDYFINACEKIRGFLADRRDYILTKYGDRYE